MKIETELKFPVADFSAVLEKLSSISMVCTPWYFEQNIVLDDEQGSLKKKDVLLRLRSGLKNKLTLKVPVEQGRDEPVKKRRELETVVDDVLDAQSIFESLGFRVRLRYEKFRQVWELNNTRVCLDILPFGRFVEVEGPEDTIMETARDLGLDQSMATPRTYYQLHKDLAGQGGKVSDDFVFDARNRRIIARSLGILT